MMRNLKERSFTSISLIILLVLIFKFKLILLSSLLILGVLAIIEFFNLTKNILRNKLNYFFLNLIFIFYLFIFCFTFFTFSYFHELKIILFCVLFACIASDTGGYVIGNLAGGPKLTKISPKKTISGAVGSVIFSCISFSLLIYFFSNNINFNIIIIGAIISLACQLGDLFFSYLKRKAKIKDTGNFLPGHGGVLDRIDGILIGLPLGYFGFILFY